MVDRPLQNVRDKKLAEAFKENPTDGFLEAIYRVYELRAELEYARREFELLEKFADTVRKENAEFSAKIARLAMS